MGFFERLLKPARSKAAAQPMSPSVSPPTRPCVLGDADSDCGSDDGDL